MATTYTEKASLVSTSAKGGNDARAEVQSIRGSEADGDEEILARMGYKQEFAREFTNLSVSPVSPRSELSLSPSFFRAEELLCATALTLYPASQTISFAFSIMGGEWASSCRKALLLSPSRCSRFLRRDHLQHAVLVGRTGFSCLVLVLGESNINALSPIVETMNSS
jgi:hypothetical protein